MTAINWSTIYPTKYNFGKVSSGYMTVIVFQSKETDKNELNNANKVNKLYFRVIFNEPC